jgi:hypothetical protein
MTASFETRLDALRDRFRGRMAVERVALENIAGDLERGASTASHRKRSGESLTGQRGPEGTFGFASVSACAGALEDFVLAAPETAELAEGCRTVVVREIERALGPPAPATLHSRQFTARRTGSRRHERAAGSLSRP